MTELNPPLTAADGLPIRGRTAREADIPFGDQGTFLSYTCHVHTRPRSFQTWDAFLAHRAGCRQGVGETPDEEDEPSSALWAAGLVEVD